MHSNTHSSSRLLPYVLITILAAVLVWGFKNVVDGNDDWLKIAMEPGDTESVIFDIEKGENGRTIANHLANDELVPSKWQLYWYLKKNDLGGNFKAGRFVLKRSMTPAEILETLTSGGGTHAITIPEGWTLDQIDARLAGIDFIQPGEFKTYATDSATLASLKTDFSFLPDLTTGQTTASLEGYLFPDTFFEDPMSFTLENFTQRLLANFEKKVMTAENKQALAASGRTWDEVITMASIVEREALLNEDYPVVTGILWKRLDNNWALEADATLLYVLENRDELAKNLNLDSPYNTRKVRGLPPTPIGNPGLKAIDAALHPESSAYWFYLNDSETGKAHYAVTNKEHNENKKKWLD